MLVEQPTHLVCGLYAASFLWRPQSPFDTLLEQVTNPKQVVLLQHVCAITPLFLPTYVWVSQSLKKCLFQIRDGVKVFQYDSCDLQDRDECTESPSICGERIKCLNTPGKLYSPVIKEQR